MINLTDQLVYVARRPSYKEIITAIDEVSTITESHIARTVEAPRPSRYSFREMFSRKNRRGAQRLDKEFLQTSLEVIRAHPHARTLIDFNCYSSSLPPADGIAHVVEGLKILLLRLWDTGAVLLPTCFLPRTTKQLLELTTLEQFDVELEGWHKADYIELLLRATDWKQPEDIDVFEASEFISAIRSARNGTYPFDFSTSSIPVSAFLTAVHRKYPSRTSYDDSTLSHLSDWSHAFQDNCLFKEYVHNPLTPVGAAKSATNKKRKRPMSARRSESTTNHRRPSREAAIESANDVAQVALLAEMSPVERNGIILQYFKTTSRLTWNSENLLDGIPRYQFREHAIPPKEVTEAWVISWNYFLTHRSSVQRIQRLANDKATRSIIFSYLFCYLPWWKEQFPNGLVEIPDRPEKFRTFPFFINSVQEQPDGTATRESDIENYPTSFRDFIKYVRPSNSSANQAIICLRLFFSCVRDYLWSDSRVCSGPFANPIPDDLNFPEDSPTKTTKVTIPAKIEGHFTMFSYAVEAFGEFLLESALEGRLNDYALSRATENTREAWDAERAGYVPLYWFRGAFQPVRMVPSIFNWETRTVRPPGCDITSVRIPHLTTLRLCIIGNEAGQRFQSIQWLDIRTWDSLNEGSQHASAFTHVPTSSYAYPLFVNTDKKRTTDRDTLISYRARACLQREADFQKRLCADYSNTEVRYENRRNSHFPPILTLFQSSKSEKCVSDSAYQDCWIELNFEFQRHYKRIDEHAEIPFVYIKPPERTELLDGESAPVLRTEDDCKYSELRYKATSTPHSSRATFVTNHLPLIDVSDVAYLVGHNTENSTVYYNKPGLEARAARFASANASVFRDFLPLEDDAYIRADKPDSSLVKSFKEDREQTISSFGFMRPFTMWGLQDLNHLADAAFELLSKNPISNIIFRETHICPVGEECPEELVVRTGEGKRCGLCPVAMKCVDHVQAISAKTNLLDERIRFRVEKYEQMTKDGEPNSTLEEAWRVINLDTSELMAWKHALVALDQEREEMQNSGSQNVKYLVDEPEIVKRKLKRFNAEYGPGLRLLNRIVEASAYPAFNTEALDIQAKALKRRLLAGRGLPDIEKSVVDGSPVVSVTAILRVIKREAPDAYHAILKSIDAPSVATLELSWQTSRTPRKTLNW
ncbi:hypothetical protein HDG40_006523 [Paraburkholderia sp. JPY158]|uniref:Uncharacterized protein n=1 Tax=Paraburkholderia atlantica TaxID=2654982 RepID=A0A7W8V9L8_PARAM|nr:hypothetical protein [Paraburkholderia atlantica]MBB5428336.1 hypothetical protein [Paraburkholderia atlantica]